MVTPLLEWFDRLRPRRIEWPAPVAPVEVPVEFDRCVGCDDPKVSDPHPFCAVCRAIGVSS